MKLTPLECPHCGAALSIDQSAKTAKCRFCDTEFVFTAEANDKNDLEIISRLADTTNKLSELEQNLAAANKQKDTMSKLLIALLCMLGVSIIVCLYFIFKLFKYSIFSWLPLLIFLLIGVGSLLLIKPVYEKLQTAISDIARIKSEKAKLISKYDLSILPRKYRTRTYVLKIYDIIFSKQAATIPDAIRIIADEEYRDEMLRLQREQIELQRKIASETERQRKAQEKAAEAASRYDDSDDDSSGLLKAGLLIGGIIIGSKFFRD